MPIINNKDLYEQAKKEVYAIYKKQNEDYLLYNVVQQDPKSGYPVFRPTKKITKETPLLVSEIDKKNLKKQIELKQKIKGSKNLKPFKKK